MKVCHLYISPGHNFFGHHDRPPSDHPTIEVPVVKCLAGRGLKGDRFFDFKENYPGQVTFFAAEVFENLCRQLGVAGKPPGVTRRNIIVQGADLNSLVGQKFTLQGVEFAGMGQCSPCHWMDHAIAPGAETALQGCGGLRARILTDGMLRVDA